MINFTVGPVQSSDAVRAIGTEQCLISELQSSLCECWIINAKWHNENRAIGN